MRQIKTKVEDEVPETADQQLLPRAQKAQTLMSCLLSNACMQMDTIMEDEAKVTVGPATDALS
jgi:uncharacterized protein (DUF4213/DUF364 family)